MTNTVMPQQRQAGDLTPAFKSPDTNTDASNVVSVFLNPVQGHTDTGVTHDGDTASLNR